MLGLLDEWKFLAGLGMFLLGMFIMEESIRLLSGRAFKTMIRRYTGSRAKGLATGIISTSVLQSSSAVSLMILAFMGAGLMTLDNAIAVIFGAKVGTTVTAWLVAVFGFKFKIEGFALPMIGIGGLGLLLPTKSPRYTSFCKLIASFGFLFYGLDFMKSSVESLSASIDLGSLPDLGLWIYVAVGILMTAIMQSSSATIAIILTGLFTGIINFKTGAAMVVGANVGTTVTILLGAIGGIPAKKRAAISSLVFSVSTAIVVMAALPFFIWLSRDLFNFADNAVMGLALFHTLFNITGITIFFPLIPALTRRLNNLFPEKYAELAKYIINTSPRVAEAAIVALRKEVLRQLHVSVLYIASRYNVTVRHPHYYAEHYPDGELPEYILQHIYYSDLERLHAEIFAFYAQIQAGEIEKKEALQLEEIIRPSRSIMNATKNLHDLMDEIEEIGSEDNPFMMEAHQGFKDRLERLLAMVDEVVERPDDREMEARLQEFFTSVENADKDFIRSCSKAVARNTIREHETTLLLMANRLFTQSNRMVVLSMQGLTHQIHAAAQPVKDAAAS